MKIKIQPMHKHSQTSIFGPKLPSRDLNPVNHPEPSRPPLSKPSPKKPSFAFQAGKPNRKLIDKMVNKYFAYTNASHDSPKIAEKSDPDEDDSFSSSELSEGPIHTPLTSFCKFSGVSSRTKQSPTSQKAKFTRVQPALVRKPEAEEEGVVKRKVTLFAPGLKKKYVLHLHQVSQSPPDMKGRTFITVKEGQKRKEEGFIKEMTERGLDKEIKGIDTLNECIGTGINKSPRNVRRNFGPLESGSSQSTTANSQGKNESAKEPSTKPSAMYKLHGVALKPDNESKNSPKTPIMMFPYQRRNRSCSPDKGDLSGVLLKSPKIFTALSPGVEHKTSPVLAKGFAFGNQIKMTPTMPKKLNENMQILNMITKSQEISCEKEYIIDDLEDDLMELRDIHEMKKEAPVPIEKVVAAPAPMAMPKAPTRGRHRRVTSQVIDKQTLNRLLFSHNEQSLDSNPI